MILIMSGNLSFLNWLTILPCLACFDDRFYARFFGKSRILEVVQASMCPPDNGTYLIHMCTYRFYWLKYYTHYYHFSRLLLWFIWHSFARSHSLLHAEMLGRCYGPLDCLSKLTSSSESHEQQTSNEHLFWLAASRQYIRCIRQVIECINTRHVRYFQTFVRL